MAPFKSSLFSLFLGEQATAQAWTLQPFTLDIQSVDGHALTAGERFGMIRFGSRLDVYLPEGTIPLVSIGQTAIAGETVLADLRGQDGDRVYRVD